MPFLTEPTESECFEAEMELLQDVHIRQEKEELKKMFPVGSKNTEQQAQVPTEVIVEEELKNCPFCGGKAKKVWIPMQVAIPNVTVGGFAISCSDCHAVQLIGANNEQDAINQWNNRFNMIYTQTKE